MADGYLDPLSQFLSSLLKKPGTAGLTVPPEMSTPPFLSPAQERAARAPLDPNSPLGQATAALPPGNTSPQTASQPWNPPPMPTSNSGGGNPNPNYPPPTDDATAINMPQLPKPPVFTGPDLSQIKKTQADINTAYQQTKPHWWERLLAAAVGTAAGWKNPEMGYEVAAGVAQRRRNAALTPLYKQLEMEKGNLPYEMMADQRAQHQFQNEMDVAQEGRQQAEARERIGNWRSQVKGREGKFVAGSELKDPNSPTGWSAETFDGERKPFTPSSATKSPRQISNSSEAYAAAAQSDDPAEQQKFNKLGDDLFAKEKQKISMEHPGAGAEKPATKGEFQKVQLQRDQKWSKAKANYRKALTDLGPVSPSAKPSAVQQHAAATQDALDQFNQDMQDAQDQFEQGITQLGGTAQHVDLAEDRQRTSASAKTNGKAGGGMITPSPSLWKDKTKALRIKQPTGEEQLWKLENGKPVQIQAP